MVLFAIFLLGATIQDDGTKERSDVLDWSSFLNKFGISRKCTHVLQWYCIMCHATMSCRIQGAKCMKCNGPHKSEYHREFGWCCKANDKTNLPRLETKKGESCPHSFKCSNCKGDHQADSVHCPFWRHWFNREWHVKKYTEIHENRSESLCSDVNANPN